MWLIMLSIEMEQNTYCIQGHGFLSREPGLVSALEYLHLIVGQAKPTFIKILPHFHKGEEMAPQFTSAYLS